MLLELIDIPVVLLQNSSILFSFLSINGKICNGVGDASLASAYMVNWINNNIRLPTHFSIESGSHVQSEYRQQHYLNRKTFGIYSLILHPYTYCLWAILQAKGNNLLKISVTFTSTFIFWKNARKINLFGKHYKL